MGAAAPPAGRLRRFRLLPPRDVTGRFPRTAAGVGGCGAGRVWPRLPERTPRITRRQTDQVCACGLKEAEEPASLLLYRGFKAPSTGSSRRGRQRHRDEPLPSAVLASEAVNTARLALALLPDTWRLATWLQQVSNAPAGSRDSFVPLLPRRGGGCLVFRPAFVGDHAGLLQTFVNLKFLWI